MDMMAGLNASFSGLNAQRTRMNVIAANLANTHSTRTPEGGPYSRKEVILGAKRLSGSFEAVLHNTLENGVSEVQILDIASAPNGTRLEYEPDHPDANTEGYVAYPNISVMHEMVDLITASRAYEANVTAINASKDMSLRALQIGRV